MARRPIPALALAAAGMVAAMPAGAEPLSAIDWLSDSVKPAARSATPAAQVGAAQAPTARADGSALPDTVTVTRLQRPAPDAAGLMPAAAIGLPAGLWGNSDPEVLKQLLAVDASTALPAVRDLLRDLLTAEFTPPPGTDGRSLFLARVDALLAMGDLDAASRLLARAEPTEPEIFRRRFDVALLRGHEGDACADLDRALRVTPTYAARIFCLARGGDWSAAALTLETAAALGLLDADQDGLLARFLDAGLAEGAPPLSLPRQPTPLTFALFEAIGEPLPTAPLPLAFAHADLRPMTGWKARIVAAERLARSGVLPAAPLFALYAERRPAASGGVWDRVAAAGALTGALAAGDAEGVAAALPDAYAQMRAAGLDMALAQHLGAALADMPLDGAARDVALRLGLLSDAYEAVARQVGPNAPADLAAAAEIAQGRVPRTPSEGPDGARRGAALTAAANATFASPTPPPRLAALVDDGRLGEAILRAAQMAAPGRAGDPEALSQALALFLSVGLEQTARRAAIQLLLLDGPR
ncbi:MAG: hypothetical protein ACU0AT_00205 [Tranquillimonas sp.]